MSELDDIRAEGELMLDLNKQSGENFQRLLEQTIMNISALKILREDGSMTEETLGN